MEQSAEFDLDLAIQQFLDSYNASGILSEVDQDELFDHLHTEINVLENVGLSTEEALMISQKRMGGVAMITSEYEKAKPWTRLIQLFAFSFIFILGLKLILNLLQIVSLSTTVLISKFSPDTLALYTQWGDVALQLLCLVIALVVSGALLKRMRATQIKSLWPVPVIYLISEIARFGSVMMATQHISHATYGGIALNGSYMMIGLGAIGVLSMFIVLIKHRNLSLQLA